MPPITGHGGAHRVEGVGVGYRPPHLQPGDYDEALAAQPGFFCNSPHATRTRNDTDGIADELYVPGFECSRHIFGPRLGSIEIVGRIKGGCFHHSFSAIS